MFGTNPQGKGIPQFQTTPIKLGVSMEERALKAYLVRRCDELGIYYRKFTSPSRVAVPDWILINNGKVVFIELKATGKKPSVSQEREIRAIRASGGYAACAASVAEIEFFISYLTEP